MSRRSFTILAALSSMCALLVSPAHSQTEFAGRAVAPGHAADEVLPATFTDGAGGAFVAFKGAPSYSQGSLSEYVAHVDANGEPLSAWAPVAIGSLYNNPWLPPILASPNSGRVWLAPDYYSLGSVNTPYLLRAAGASGLTSPDSSLAAEGNRFYNSLTEIAPGRMLLASKQGLGGPALFLAILEPTGELNLAPIPIGLPGAWSLSSNEDERGPVTLADDAGGAWVLSEFTSNGRDIAAVRIAADGSSALSPPYRVVCGAANDQSEARAALDDSGGVFIVWTDRRDLTKSADVFASHLLADGSLAPGVPILGRAIASLVGDQFQPQIVSDGSAGAWLVWTDSRSGANDIYYTHIGADGLPKAGFPAGGKPLCAAAGSQIDPRIVADGERGFYAVWSDARNGGLDLFAQHIHSTGEVMPGWVDNGVAVCTEASDQESPALVLSSPHHAIATWVDTRTGYPKVYAATLPPDGSETDIAPRIPTLALSVRAAQDPARDAVQLIVTSSEAGDVRVTLHDVTGRVVGEQVLRGPVNAASVQFAAARLGPGLYFARASRPGVTTNARVSLVR